MDRELLIEIGCEELPAGWLPGLTAQLKARLEGRLAEFRLAPGATVETFSTPRRLTARIQRLAERQEDLEETITGPPVSAGIGRDGQPTPAGQGFARKQGVAFEDLARVATPKGEYLAYHKRVRGRAAADVLGDVLAGTLRDLAFPKQMHWDAMLEDGRGELLFGRPIRWLLFLYGGRVVPFSIGRTALGRGPLVQDVVSAAVTYGHRFLATSGRAGRSIKVRSFDEYKARLAEHFVILEREERFDRIKRELDRHARRLGGRVLSTGPSSLLDEVPDLVEYPAVVAGFFDRGFLELPEEVLTTTMIHHQHFFPVVNEQGQLKEAFLAVVNTDPPEERTIARNVERVLTARLRDARFFWDADRRAPLESKLDRLETVLFHKKLGSYREKTDRIARLAEWIATEAFGRPDQASHARTAAHLAKTDLTTDMVGEFPELQGTMGGIYAREEGLPEEVWKAIYFQYLPIGVEAAAPPVREQLGPAAVSWAALSLADKLDTVVSLFKAGERPTGSRDPFGMRRQTQGIVKILMDLPDLGGPDREVFVEGLFERARAIAPATGAPDVEAAAPAYLAGFVLERLRYALEQRGFEVGVVRAVTHQWDLSPLRARRVAQALQDARTLPEFDALAVLFKRVKNIARELKEDVPFDRSRLTEAAEVALVGELDRRRPVIEGAARSGEYAQAFREIAALRPAVDRFFTDVFVMVDDARLKNARLKLTAELRDMVLRLADISEIVTESASQG